MGADLVRGDRRDSAGAPRPGLSKPDPGSDEAGEPDGVRIADLSPRLPSRYAPPRTRIAPWLIMWAAMMLFGLAKAFPPKDQLYLGSPWLLVGTAVVIAALAEAALWVIARRPQITGSESRRSADDALRSTGATAAVASSIMMALFTLLSGVQALLQSGQRGWLGVPLALVSAFAAYLVFLAIVTQQPWAPVWRWPVDTGGEVIEEGGIEEGGTASEPRLRSLPDGIRP